MKDSTTLCDFLVLGLNSLMHSIIRNRHIVYSLYVRCRLPEGYICLVLIDGDHTLLIAELVYLISNKNRRGHWTCRMSTGVNTCSM